MIKNTTKTLRSHPKLSIMGLAGILLIAVSAPFLLSSHSSADTTSQRGSHCQEVSLPSSTERLIHGAQYDPSNEYEGIGVWTSSDGSVLGWAKEEDSTIWSTPSCVDPHDQYADDKYVDNLLKEMSKDK